MSDDEENEEEVDISVIRKAIKISGNMIEQILKGIHYGSPEVRCLLYSECDYILECKVCRNLFRSLPNFVAHKRAYCKHAYQESDTFFGHLRTDEETVIIQPEAPEDSASVSNKRSKSRTLESTIQLLKDGTLGKSDAYRVYSQAADKMEQQKEFRTTQTLNLEAIPNTTQAMKVTVTDGLPPESNDECLTDTKTLQSSPTATLKSMLLKSALEGDGDGPSQSNDSLSASQTPMHTPTPNTTQSTSKSSSQAKLPAVISPPKKMTLRCKEGINSMPWKKARKEDQESDSPDKGMDFNNLLCLDCNTSFRSRKTLIFHYQNAHCGKRTFYPCPYCKSVFFYIFGLTRHLLRNHNKSKAQVDKMRSKLKKSAFVKQVTEPCQSAREQILHVKDCEMSEEQVKDVNKQQAYQLKSKPTTKKEVEDIIENDVLHSPTKEEDYICSNCDRVFGKKISLLNHRKMCLTQGCVVHRSKQKTTALIEIKKPAAESTEISSSTNRAVNMTDSATGIISTGTNKHLGSLTDFAVDPTKKPIVKTTGTTNRARFSARSTSQRLDYAKMINIGLSELSSPEDKKINSTEKDQNMEKNLREVMKNRHRNKRGQFLVDKKETQSAKEDEVKKEVGTDIMSEEEDGSDMKRKVRVVEEIWVDKQPGRPTEKVKSNRTYVMKSAANQKLECQDTKKVTAIVNESDLQCRHCDQEFSNVSNLRRHAIRHLGWKRYKCKMCKFSSYNKSECNTHLFRTHSDRFRNVSSVNSLIVDLGKEGSRARLRKKQQTLSEKLAIEDSSTETTCHIRKQNRKKIIKSSKRDDDTSAKQKSSAETNVSRFNISTRNSPREFDTSPYKKDDTMTTLCTRKSSYPKKITINSQTDYDSDQEDCESFIAMPQNVKSGKTDSVFMSYLCEISAKAKVDDMKMEVSDTDSETSNVNKLKHPKHFNAGGDSPVTRRSVRSGDSAKSSPVKSGMTSMALNRSAEDSEELKASKNLTFKIVD